MATVSEQIQAMRGLPENWDGYGAAPPSGNVIDLAQAFTSFLEAAFARSAAVLHVSPTRVGGILIEWEDSTRQHEVEINPDQGISFLHLQKSTGEITTRLFSPSPHTVVHPGLLQKLRQLLAA